MTPIASSGKSENTVLCCQTVVWYGLFAAISVSVAYKLYNFFCKRVFFIHRASGDARSLDVSQQMPRPPNGDKRVPVTLRYAAAQSGNAEMVQWLATVNLPGREPSGSTRLHGVAFRGHEEVVEIPLANGATSWRDTLLNEMPRFQHPCLYQNTAANCDAVLHSRIALNT
jgi:hypothetical protein